MDAIYDDVNQREDESWNAIWDSVGQITESGYTVELAIPLKQLRFSETESVQVWGIDFYRICFNICSPAIFLLSFVPPLHFCSTRIFPHQPLGYQF